MLAQIAPSKCSHKHFTLTMRREVNGKRLFVQQCDGCGKQIGDPIPVLIALERGYNDWDTELFETGKVIGKTITIKRRRESAHTSAEWRKRYELHLQSDKWKKLRERVLDRCNGICEGCAQRPAVQVHHLTYEHMGNELLWELVGVCALCHRRCHPEKE